MRVASRTPLDPALPRPRADARGLARARPPSPGPRRPRRAPAPLPVMLPASASAWDMAVGRACERALGRTRGAVVAMDPHTGRVQALVNPVDAMQRAYQPCSVFKIVVAIAGLSEGVITPETTYRCSKGCSMWSGHGPIELRRALAVSCNTYFEWVGEQLGYDKIQRYAHLLGLGEPSGINLTGETAGCVPASVRPDAVGHLSSHAAGIATSAVQLAVLISAAINGGVVLQPTLSAARDFVPARALEASRGHEVRRSRRRVPGGGQRGQRQRGLRPAGRGRRQDRDLLGPRLVRLLRARRPSGAGGRRLPPARQRPPRLRRGRPDLPGAVRRAAGPSRRRPRAAARPARSSCSAAGTPGTTKGAARGRFAARAAPSEATGRPRERPVSVPSRSRSCPARS